MSGYHLEMVSELRAGALAATLPLRPDMAEQWEESGGALTPGPKWALWDGGRLLGIGGLTPRGAATSTGWLLVGQEVEARDWAMARRAMRQALDWIARRGVKRVQVLVEAGRFGAQRLMVRLGFEATSRDGDDITMTKELT